MRSVRRRDEREHGEWLGRGEYGAVYEAPYQAGFHGFGMGYRGGALRSRGSYQAGQLRSGLNPVDEFEFEWGGGYRGGRGYGGTNYDLQHGYLTTARPRATPPVGGAPRRELRATGPATRGGYSWTEEEYAPPRAEPRGPSRYGYGPYHERLLRRRRDDEEIRRDVEETLFYDTWVDADRIGVEVEDGIVTLRGTLSDYEEVRYATDDAWDVDGVRGVRSELVVAAPGPAGRRSEEAAAAAARREAGIEERGAVDMAEGRTAPRGRSRAGSTRRGTTGRKTTARKESGRRAAGSESTEAGPRSVQEGAEAGETED